MATVQSKGVKNDLYRNHFLSILTSEMESEVIN